MARRFNLSVTWTLEECYTVEADTWEEASEQAIEEFKQDFNNLPFWAGDNPEAIYGDEEELEDD